MKTTNNPEIKHIQMEYIQMEYIQTEYIQMEYIQLNKFNTINTESNKDTQHNQSEEKNQETILYNIITTSDKKTQKNIINNILTKNLDKKIIIKDSGNSKSNTESNKDTQYNQSEEKNQKTNPVINTQLEILAISGIDPRLHEDFKQSAQNFFVTR